MIEIIFVAWGIIHIVPVIFCIQSLCWASLPKITWQIYILYVQNTSSTCDHAIRGAVCFQFTHSPCDDWENIYTLSDYHYQIGSMNYYPLFRVRSWNNGVRCMSFCILMPVCWIYINIYWVLPLHVSPAPALRSGIKSWKSRLPSDRFLCDITVIPIHERDAEQFFQLADHITRLEIETTCTSSRKKALPIHPLTPVMCSFSNHCISKPGRRDTSQSFF